MQFIQTLSSVFTCLYYNLFKTLQVQHIIPCCLYIILFADCQLPVFNYTLITNLMYWLLFIHKILFSCTCSEHQVLVFRRT